MFSGAVLVLGRVIIISSKTAGSENYNFKGKKWCLEFTEAQKHQQSYPLKFNIDVQSQQIWKEICFPIHPVWYLS